MMPSHWPVVGAWLKSQGQPGSQLQFLNHAPSSDQVSAIEPSSVGYQRERNRPGQASASSRVAPVSKGIYYCAASLDGYIAESDDTLDWLIGYSGSFEGDELESGPMVEGGGYERFYETVGALVSGSATYEFVIDHIGPEGKWP